MKEVKDVPVILNNIQYEDDYAGDFAQRRAVIYTLQFVVKTYLYGPVTEGKIIKKVQTDMYSTTDTVNAPRQMRYIVEPDPLTADADDDFGFNEMVSMFTDNKKRNPVTGEDEEIT